MMHVLMSLQQKQEQDQSTHKMNDAAAAETSDAGGLQVSVSCSTTTATMCEPLITRPVMPFAQSWLTSSSKSVIGNVCIVKNNNQFD